MCIMKLLKYEMTAEFANLGVNTNGGEVVFVEADNTTVQDKAALLEKAVNVFNLPLADDYIYEQLHIEKPDNYDQLKKEMEEKKAANNPFIPPTNDKEEKPQNRSKSFFVNAPRKGALKW